MPPTRTAKQTALISPEANQVRELFYGGAAGGAKSAGLLLAALQYVDDPSYSALIVRKTFAQLGKRNALMDLSHQWLDATDAVWQRGGHPHTWTFPSGATLEFGHISNAAAVSNYQGAAYHFIGVDECTDFDERTFSFLFSRLRRRADSTIPPRFRAASNPGGPGHEWCKARYVDPRTRREGSIFLPAHLDDNPFLDRDDYIESLRSTFPITWARLLHGDWEITESGRLFRSREWLANSFVDEAPEGMPTVRYWDFAASEPTPDYPDPDWTVGTKLVHDVPRRKVIVADVVRGRWTSAKVEAIVRATAEADGRAVTVGIEKEGGSSGVFTADHFADNVLLGWTVIPDRPSGAKEVRARPVAAAMERGTIEVVRAPWNGAWMDELDQFDFGSHDDQVDSLSGGWKLLTNQPRPRKSEVNARTVNRQLLGTPMARVGITGR